MGKRFLHERYPWEDMGYTNHKIILRLNESDWEPHRMLPYGSEIKRVEARQIYTRKHMTRTSHRNTARMDKKAARHAAKQELRHQMEDNT